MTNAALRRRRLARAIAPAVGLLAAGLLVWQGSYAAFSASTNATNNVWHRRGSSSLPTTAVGRRIQRRPRPSSAAAPSVREIQRRHASR